MSENLIGKEVEAYCGKCKTDTLHVITSLLEDKVDKAMCKVCESYHKFRKPKGTTEKSAKTSTKTKTTKKVVKRKPRRDKWTRLLDQTESDAAIEYKMDIDYEIATAIHHKTFGLGVVKNIIDSRKIEVLFHDGGKILVQNLIG